MRIPWMAAAAVVCVGLAAPARADKIDDLEARAQKEIEDATEMLSKVQTGSMPFRQAFDKMNEYMLHMEEFEEAAEQRAEKYIEELQETMYWTRKFAPLKGNMPTTPAAPATPATAPATAPTTAPATAPATAPPTPPANPPDAPPAAPPATPKKQPKRQISEEPDPADGRPKAPEVPAGYTPPALPDQPRPRALALIPLLQGTDKAAQIFACREAPLVPERQLVNALFEVVKASPDPEVVGAAGWALTLTRHDAVFDNFAKAVEAWNEDALERLMLIMRELPEKRTVSALFGLALRFIPPIGGADSRDADAMDRYKSKVKSFWAQGWRGRVVAVWRGWPEPVVSAGLAEAWERRKKIPERQEILLATGVIGNSRGIRHAVPFLTQGKEENSPLRAPAEAAVELVGKPAIPWLIGGLSDGTTKNRCVESLRTITGVVMSSQPKLWWQWWNDNR